LKEPVAGRRAGERGLRGKEGRKRCFGKKKPRPAPGAGGARRFYGSFHCQERSFQGRFAKNCFGSGSFLNPSGGSCGYESLRNLIVRRVDGRDIRDIATLIEAFKSNEDGLHSIEFVEEDFTIHLDETVSSAVDSMLLQRGLPRLSHAGD
jgi:hypothetical protein